MFNKVGRMQVIRNSFSPHHIKLTVLSLTLVVALATVIAIQPVSMAQTDSALASQFAPVLHFTQGEKFYPTPVEYIIGNSVLKQREAGGVSSTTIDSAPRPDTLGTHIQQDLFLDNKRGTFENIAADYSANVEDIGYYAYYRVDRSGSSPVIQYWLFYVYNNGPLNDHQGDLEVIQIFLDGSGTPRQALYSQHGSGQSAAWADVEKVDSHPVVYVAQGSHANYFRSYQGKMGIESDIVGADGKTIMPDDLELVPLGEKNNPSADQSWLSFPGRWGYWGTEAEVALGRAGPYGPAFNQDGVRWSEPHMYLASTFRVDGTYFILSWLVASFLLLFLIYVAASIAWKAWRIYRLRKREGGLLVGKFLKGRGGIGLIIGISAIIVTIAALFAPWYNVTAFSESGPLAQQGGVTLMSVDGVNGIKVNLFLGAGNSDASSGYVNLFSTAMPFAIIIATSAILLALDVIGVKSGRHLGMRFIIGMVTILLPIILIIVFISQLSALLPLASGLFPGQGIPSEVESMVRNISASPVQGTSASQFPVIGLTSISWGLGVGAYLFIVAAVLSLVAGIMMITVPELHREAKPLEPLPPPPPPT